MLSLRLRLGHAGGPGLSMLLSLEWLRARTWWRSMVAFRWHCHRWPRALASGDRHGDASNEGGQA